MSQAKFQKHVYGKEKQYAIQPLETFDPRPTEFKGTATACLRQFIENTKGKCSCVSLLFDESTQVWKTQAADEKIPGTIEYNICSKAEIEREVAAFKESLKLDEAHINEIERETTEQAKSSWWYCLRRLRLTASHFGEILRGPTTRPDTLVMKILGNTSQKISTSMEWGRQHESIVFEMYKQKKLREKSKIVVSKSGLWISHEYPFLGASPDAAIYDPTEKEPYGFAETKCPYKHRSSSLSMACEDTNFCCRLPQ